MKKFFTSLFLLSIYFASTIINNDGKALAADITVKAKTTNQTMIGFGAAIAWADGQLSSHPKRNEIYHYIFEELGLDVLRLRNTYRNGSVGSGTSLSKIVAAMDTVANEKPKILISSWSPPVNLKSNNSTENGGTLKKDTSGKYMYADFAKYWVDAVSAHTSLGIVPDYISIQNEPNYTATWESCRFDGTETTTNAGYNKALDSVYSAFQKEGLQTKIIGPEPLGIGYSAFQNYANSLTKSHLDGYAYHLYHGESDNVNDNHNPDLFIPNLSTIAKNYPGKPIWVTEYDRGDWLNTVWLMSNCIVHGNVSAYLWWELVWGSGGKPLVEMQSSAYTISKYYWAFRQFSKFVSSGWKRVTTENDTTGFRISAFVAPDGKKLSAVVINRGSQTSSKNFAIQDFAVDSGRVIRTSDTESGAVISENFNGTSSLDFPARSITTIQFFGDVVTGVEAGHSVPLEFSLFQNYPNPFNPGTEIKYQTSEVSHVTLKVFDIVGREVATLVNEVREAGSYSVTFNASKLASGMYFAQLQSGGKQMMKKMTVLK